MGKQTLGWSLDQFRAMALERMRTCHNIKQLCAELGVSRRTLEKWNQQVETPSDELEPATTPLASETTKEENRCLKLALEEKAVEADSLKGASRNVETRRHRNALTVASASTSRSSE